MRTWAAFKLDVSPSQHVELISITRFTLIFYGIFFGFLRGLYGWISVNQDKTIDYSNVVNEGEKQS